VAILSARFRVLLQYRAAAAAGVGTQLFWGLVRVMIFQAFYASTIAPQPMSIGEVVTYIWLGQALLGMLPWGVDRDVQAIVRSGVVAYEIARPVDLYSFWFARSVALRSAPTILRALPQFVIATAFLGMSPPASWSAASAWLVATVGALILSAAITTLITVSLLWTISGEGPAVILIASVTLLSGMVVPLPLFPDWAQTMLSVLPFRGLMDAPFRLYLGHIPASGVLGILAHQAIWIGVFVIAGRALLARGMRRVVIQGG
jgi:ABC-2 type transport system permease protein